MKTWKIFTYYSLVVAFILFASIAMVEAADTDNGGGNPLYGADQNSGEATDDVSVEALCTMNIKSLTYNGDTLSMILTVGWEAPLLWNVYLSVFNTTIPLFEKKLWEISPIAPPTDIPISFPLPSLGGVGILTTLTSANGIICSDWRTVDTGTPPS
jgi:hypothetical protein